ncbi:MAG TPA: hypothetical protein DCR24_00940 [Bacillus bacterium]|nr:hypothetical protein [Bacillus sp. (in: firmicutes)]
MKPKACFYLPLVFFVRFHRERFFFEILGFEFYPKCPKRKNKANEKILKEGTKFLSLLKHNVDF